MTSPRCSATNDNAALVQRHLADALGGAGEAAGAEGLVGDRLDGGVMGGGFRQVPDVWELEHGRETGLRAALPPPGQRRTPTGDACQRA